MNQLAVITALLFISSLLFVCNCDPPLTVAFIFDGTVLPQGNYHVFVRTIPAAEVLTILKSYDNKISATETEMKMKNAAWMKHRVIPGLKEERFQAENAFGVLGDAIVKDGTKFELKLDWKKAHDAYFKREFDPIYVQIYAIDGPFETSLIERILINPSNEKEYVFIFGTPREGQKQLSNQQQIGEVPQKFVLGNLPISNAATVGDESDVRGEIVEKYAVKIHKSSPAAGLCQSGQIANIGEQIVEIDSDGNFAIEFPNDLKSAEEIFLTFRKAEGNDSETLAHSKVFPLDDPAVSLSFGSVIKVRIDFKNGKLAKNQTDEFKFKAENTWKIDGLIENLPKNEGYTVSKVEVKLFSTYPFSSSPNASSSSLPQNALQTIEAKKSAICEGAFLFDFNEIQTSELSSFEIKKTKLHGLRTKSERKTGTIYLVVEATESPIYKMIYPSLTQMGQYNGEDLSLYRYKFATRQANGIDNDTQIALEPEKAKMIDLYRAYLIRNKTDEQEIALQVEAFAMSLQMIHVNELTGSDQSDG